MYRAAFFQGASQCPKKVPASVWGQIRTSNWSKLLWKAALLVWVRQRTDTEIDRAVLLFTNASKYSSSANHSYLPCIALQRCSQASWQNRESSLRRRNWWKFVLCFAWSSFKSVWCNLEREHQQEVERFIQILISFWLLISCCILLIYILTFWMYSFLANLADAAVWCPRVVNIITVCAFVKL